MRSSADALIRKLESIGELSGEDREALMGLPFRERELRPGEDAVREGDAPSDCCLLIAGFLHSYKLLADGKRQILALYTPGDIPDLQSLHLRRMDNSLAALVTSQVAFITHDSIREIMRRQPRLRDILWRETLIDSAIFRQSIVGLGRRSAHAHLAHLLCELFVRLKAVGLANDQNCKLPLTQAEIGDALGLSFVHVNRMLQELRGERLIELQSGVLTILDWRGLKHAAEFDPTYLNLRHPEIAE